jgi:hypothetical protein
MKWTSILSKMSVVFLLRINLMMSKEIPKRIVTNISRCIKNPKN